MKILFTYLVFISVLLSCNGLMDNTPMVKVVDKIVKLNLPQDTVLRSQLVYNKNNSCWTLGDNLFSGYVIEYYSDKSKKQQFGILSGKKQDQFIEWFPDGHIKQLSNFHEGKLHGEKQIWSSSKNHSLLSQLNYHMGKAHGVQKKWYPTGELFKLLNLNMGIEEGMQQAFRKNGDLFANYEAKEGRIFGLKKASLCYGLDDEIIQYAQ